MSKYASSIPVPARELALETARLTPWDRSDSYRPDILNHLGLPQRDKTLGLVQQYGGGSSFQKQQQVSQDLQTDHREMQMSDDPKFQATPYLTCCGDAVMQQLSLVFDRFAERLGTIATGNSLAPEPVL